jgi:chromosomal replication initiation ATPase DnaA
MMKICIHCGQVIMSTQVKHVSDLNGQYLRRDDIIETVLKYFERESISELQVQSRKREISYQRMIMMVFLKKKTKMTMEEVVNKLNRKDHTKITPVLCTHSAQ